MFSHWWVQDAWNQSPVILLAWVFWVILAITLHELAHGWTAIRCGDRTPIDSGHMTWNPVVHMGSASLVMFALWGIAWGAMPINPANFRSRLDHAKVALAGPSMNLVLFAVALGVSAALKLEHQRFDPETFKNLFLFFVTGAWINMTLTLFNLLPVPPLDGWRIASDLWPGYGALWARGNAPTLSIVIIAVMFIFVGPRVWDTAADFTFAALNLVTGAMGTPRHSP